MCLIIFADLFLGSFAGSVVVVDVGVVAVGVVVTSGDAAGAGAGVVAVLGAVLGGGASLASTETAGRDINITVAAAAAPARGHIDLRYKPHRRGRRRRIAHERRLLASYEDAGWLAWLASADKKTGLLRQQFFRRADDVCAFFITSSYHSSHRRKVNQATRPHAERLTRASGRNESGS